MQLGSIRIGIAISSAVVALLVFAFIVLMALKYKPGKVVSKVYFEFSNYLKAGNSLINYEKINRFLVKTGARYHFGIFADPIFYMALKWILAFIGLWLASGVSLVLCIPAALFAYNIPNLLLVYLNEQDNKRMMEQIRMVYNTISTQVQAGVQIVYAVTECYSTVTGNKRLYDALLVLSGDLIMNANIEDSLARFSGQFSNRYIDGLCIIIQQATESGQSVDLLKDMAEQMRDLEAASLINRKASLDRSLTFFELGILACAVALTLYVCIMYMFSVASNF